MSAPRKPEIVLIRHGETEWSKALKHTGRTDLPLTDEGRRMAGLVGRALKGRTFALVLTSPLQRARETCALAGLGDQAQIRPDLLEWDYGAYEGLTTAEIREKNPSWSLWDDGVPEGETAADVGTRVDRVIAEVRGAPGDAALFAHAHVLRVLAARWLDLPPDAGRLFALATATISILGYEREQPVIGCWNDNCHLHVPSG
jgi:probable phosphoglycerate mutase